MKNLTIQAISVLLLVSFANSFASEETHETQKEARSGEEVAKQCISCHGEDGNSIAPNFPKISGQYQSYLYHSLMSYKNGDRKNAIMAGIVAALTEEEIKNVSAYYANKEGKLTVVDIEDESTF